MTAEEYFQRGNEYRQRGDWQEALANYMEAIELDPNSPAVVAKEMLENILNFYNKDAYNP
ncbi:tetratricopeptide repeat protein [Prevotella jejuni]|uniref:Tetratricopeptide repeat-containing protein n=1 Tax=Prevotella jejuni TaxID=1177574 RepID=A0A2K9HDA2_9BACT|nr:tetratricopeptide repeat protein [Prevotella jejuni]AUI54805.1 tetratricopeptide repeat protein [Prevotella jejuni]SNR76509.1 Tetratricopeptide repeat-containing protein [Prevotella jejuni]